jgi:YbbR domain-containing protein
VYTEAIDITGASETVAANVAIDLASLPEGVTVLTPASSNVEVIVAISPLSSPPQSLPGQAIQVVGLDPGLTAVVDPAELSVVVETSEQQIEQLEAGDIIVSVDATSLEPGAHQIQPSVSVPPEMSWIRTDPELVTVTISETDAFNGDAVPGLGDIQSAGEAPISPEASPVP